MREMLSPGAAIGRYVIHKKLAEGGMAEVYLASAVGPEGFTKDVVIKVVRGFLASDQQFIDLFIAEARLSSRLNHANVVQIFDFGKADDSYYLAMEYVRGASLWDLRKRCRERGISFPPTLAAEIGTQVARGLQYAHTLSDRGQPLGIVHRDVTPHNVLLSFDGAIKLTDFGIAKAGSTQTAPGILKGKFAYMSPEQARGDRVDARSDVFSMGIVLWELLTGGRLFEADSEVGVLRAVQTATIVAPARLNPHIPEALSEIVMKALARPLDERFQSAQELERALAMFVLGTAKTLDDTSSSRFLQEMFRQEYESVHQAPAVHDALAIGPTLAVARVQLAPADEHTAPALDAGGGALAEEVKPTDELPAVRAVSPSGRLQPGPPTPKPRTDLNRVTRASRKLPALESAATTLPDTDPPRGWGAAIAVGLVTVLVAVGGSAWLTREQAASPMEAPVEPPVERVPAEVAVPPDRTPARAVVTEPAAVALVIEPVPSEVLDAGVPDAGVRVIAALGTVEVRAVPYATLTIDGRGAGEVQGSRRLRLTVGAHELVLNHPQLTKRERVMVRVGQTVSIAFDALAK